MDWPYLIFALSNFILYAWYDVMYVYLYNYAETDLRINPSDATKFLSIIGILNTLGELIIGWLGDRPDVNLNFLYSICMIVCGGATAMVPFLSNYYALCVMAGLYGLCISANYALTSPILVNLVSLEQFSNAYGFLLLVQGVSNLLGPPFAGFLYDVYKIWHYTFGLGGLFIVLSGLLLLILPCLRQVKRLGNQRLSQNKGQIKANRFTGESMLILASILHLGRSGLPSKAITHDDADRIALCLKFLAESGPEDPKEIFSKDCRSALMEMIEAFGSTMETAASKKKIGSLATQADSPIKFSQLSKGNDLASAGDIFELGLSQALGTSKKESAADFSSSKLSKVRKKSSKCRT